MVNLITEHMDIWTAAQTPKVNGGRGRGKNSNGQNSHGIRKLRELILELAVRGKLVPQDSEDEPASVLLEKIAKEKARLIKEGKIKKQKSLADISEDEKPFSLPEGWEWTQLGNLSANIHYGYTASAVQGNSIIRLLRITDIQNDSVNWETVPGCEIEENKVNEYLLENDDILIARTGGTIGKSYLVEHIDVKAVFASYLIRVKRIEGMYSPFIKTYLGSQLYWQQLYENSMGTGQPNVNATALKNLAFPIPPLAEQHRIVAKVDELMVLCDQLELQQTDSNAAHQTLVETLLATLTNAADQREFAKAWQRISNHFDTLFTSEQSIDQLKQTILQLAVMGKLVPQDPIDLPAPVRASHADGPRPGTWFVYALECEDGSIYIGQVEDVLERWKQHATGRGAEWTRRHPPVRLVHWEEFNSFESAVKREKELKTGFGRKWLKRELAAGRTRQAGEPASVLLAKIAEEKARLIKEGKIKKQKPLPEISDDEKPFELPKGWEWERFGELVIFKSELVKPIDFPDLDQVAPDSIEKGTGKLLSRRTVKESGVRGPNNKFYAGQILYSKIRPSLSKAIIAPFDGLCSADMYPLESMVDSKFLLKAILSEVFLEQVRVVENRIKMPKLNVLTLSSIIVPLPPLSEQKRIVAKADELMALCDTLKKRLNNAQTAQVQLADAIVEQAVA